MPKFKCLCGNIINLSKIPNPDTYKITSEPLYESLQEEIAETIRKHDLQESFFRELIFLFQKKFMPVLYECDHCGRIAVLKKASDIMPAFWLQKEVVNDTAHASLKSLFDQSAEPDTPSS